MKSQQIHYITNNWRNAYSSPGFENHLCQLVLIFGESGPVTDPELFAHIKKTYPNADLIFSSTAGEILGESVYDNSVVVTAIQFEKTSIACRETNIRNHKNSYETGRYLMENLDAAKLESIFIISDGTHINGSELVTGINENNKNNIPVTGGLAGDGARFTKTFAGLNRVPEEGMVIAIGFYGSSLSVGHGSFGGWDEFGPTRRITRSNKNVLYEIDGKNALELYKEYLGPYKDELPGSALLFPLSITEPSGDMSLVRTILNINEDEKSMTFAGNMPEGSKLRLMKANFDKLIEGSSTAANNSFKKVDRTPDLAILISCIGRKLILQERTDEEVLAAKDIFGNSTCITGFYSYGEISPFNNNSRCELHNQTMTITTFTES